MKDVKSMIKKAKKIDALKGKEKHIDFLFNYIGIFNTLKYDDYSDWLYREFDDIKADKSIKNGYSKCWKCDMDAIIECVDILKENNFKLSAN